MCEPLTPYKLPNNPENSDTFINKAVLTVASYTRTVYYKYNRILVFYHLPFAFMCSMNCLFLFICLLIFGDLTKLILPLSVCVALWDFYYIFLFFKDMEDDFNRLVDRLEDYPRVFNIFLDFFSKFYQSFANAFKQFAMEAINSIQWNHYMELNCKYIYML